MSIDTKTLRKKAAGSIQKDILRNCLLDAADALDARAAEIAQLRAVLAPCVRTIKRDRDELELCAIDPKTGTVAPDDQLTRDGLQEYDAVLVPARAALQGESK